MGRANRLLHALSNSCKVIAHMETIGIGHAHTAPNFCNIAPPICEHDPVLRQCLVQTIKSIFKVDASIGGRLWISLRVCCNIVRRQFLGKSRGNHLCFVHPIQNVVSGLARIRDQDRIRLVEGAYVGLTVVNLDNALSF